MSDEAIQQLGFHHSAGQPSPVDVVYLSDLRARNVGHSIFDPTRLTFHLLQFVTAGHGAHWIDFERIPLQRGDVLHIRPEQIHAFDMASDHEALLLLFPAGTLRRAHIPHLAQWQTRTVLRPAPQDFGVLTELLRVQQALDTEANELRPDVVGPHLLGTVLASLTEVVRARQDGLAPTAQRYEALVLAFEALLDEHHATSRSAAWYAAELRTTPRTLARACRMMRGLSPKRLIDSHVALEAKRCLVTTVDTVEAIGYTLGFSEPTNFVKFFKRVAGTTPEAFRQASQ